MRKCEMKNLLLSSIPPDEYRRLELHMECVVMDLREVLCQPGDPVRYAYFPLSSMISSIVLLKEGTAVEAATIGKEGMVNVGLLIGEGASHFRVIQQVSGKNLRIPVDRFLACLQDSPGLREILQRYTFTLLQQTGQNAACNLHHRIEQRMCRWLLQTSDRAGRLDFLITQEFLSEMLGVSRQTINVTARKLQQVGLIEYSRGHVSIRDRESLEGAACECYVLFNEIYFRYMKMRIKKPG